MLIVLFIFILSFIYVNIFKTKRYLHMLQQNLYNENNRYLKWLKKNSKLLLDYELISIVICLIGIFVIYDLKIISIIGIIIISVINLILGLKWKKNIKNDQNKKKLVITARIKRLITTISILFIIPFIILGLHLTSEKEIWII